MTTPGLTYSDSVSVVAIFGNYAAACWSTESAGMSISGL